MNQEYFDFDPLLVDISDKIEDKIKDQFSKVALVAEKNQQKVLRAFLDCRVSETHFNGSTGYGYNDVGREVLDKVYAQVFDCEDALVRHTFFNGTHAIAIALFSVLRPGDEMVSITGDPYDTLKNVIGLGEKSCDGSLKDFKISFRKLDFLEDGEVDFENIPNIISENTKLVYVQRSGGYSTRRSLFCSDIKKICDIVKSIKKDVIILVDNCYGEFVEEAEPTKFGADLIAGSLIKNPGGGIVRSGGYIAGKKELIFKCASRLATPGIGKEVGATLGMLREMFLGFFCAPGVVGEALKTAIFAAAFLEELGFEVSPKFYKPRSDIIQMIKFGRRDLVIKFCQGIQSASPVDSFAVPTPWAMPGYSDEVIMAAGTFTLGSSIELSADAPLREPFALWMQGGTNFYSAKIGVMKAIENIFYEVKEWKKN